jgi:hypothetical protein
MNRLLSALAFAMAAPLAVSAAPVNQSTCNALWSKVNPGGAATITEAQAQPYVTNFKAADPDNDGTLTKSEFSAACESGYVTAMAGQSEGSKMAPKSDPEKELQ